MTHRTVLDQLLQAAADDWVGVWELPWLAESAGGARGAEEVLKLSLQVIRHSLDEGLLEVGDVTEAGFRSWSASPEEACRRIEREWRRYPDGPRLGDVSCWFNLTAKGQRHLGEPGAS